MKTTQECWQALIDGEALKNNSGVTAYLVDGMVFGGWNFKRPELWSIYTTPKWYENIPEVGVLCWCWDINKERVSMRVVINYVPLTPYPFKVRSNEYQNAEPLTKQEIQQLLDNAPEGEVDL